MYTNRFSTSGVGNSHWSITLYVVRLPDYSLPYLGLGTARPSGEYLLTYKNGSDENIRSAHVLTKKLLKKFCLVFGIYYKFSFGLGNIYM